MKASRLLPREAELTGHKNITRPLCVLSAPIIRSIPDNKVVTEYAKCARHFPGMRKTRSRVTNNGEGCPIAGQVFG
jgi:hypothetical protein